MNSAVYEAVVALAILIGQGLLAWALVYAARHAWTHKQDIHEFDDEDMEAARWFLEEWLHDERIVRSMLETGTTNHDSLQKTLLLLPMMGQEQIRSTLQSLLRIKNVRRVIALQVMKAHNIPKEQHWMVVRDLARYASVEQPRRNVEEGLPA